MAQYTRANAWNNSGTFDNPDLLWYAKGVGAMQARELSDPSSWWFFAAIHGEYVSEQGFPGWGSLPSPPAVPTSPLPSRSDQEQYWDQCQHQSWYFTPWHRGYLLALEAQIRAEVIKLGGPETWALPYWNYFGPGEEFNIPPAFTQKTLPDGSPNPLFVTARYGPDGDGNIYVPTPAAIQQYPNDPDFVYGPVTQECMSNDLYTGSDAATPPPGFGGPETGFSHSGRTSGNLENNPHNLVHVYVGGNAPDGQTYGLMSDPGLAGLDPIFYLHHANIDRMWAVWNASSNPNPKAEVIKLGGPETWALPYWNYFGPGEEFNIPPAFTQKTLPDGSPNPLFVTARYGPDGDGNIYVPTPAAIQQYPNDPDFVYGPVTQECMSNDLYTGSDAATPPPGFGGPETGFSHSGRTSGNLENNPHNLVQSPGDVTDAL